jgi:hypothetical protein
MTPQDVFTPKELGSIVESWQLKAGGLFALSLHDKGLLDLDGPKMKEALAPEGKYLDDCLDRYNAALIQSGESPVALDQLVSAITGGGLVKMTP